MPIITLEQLPVREIFPGIRARLVHTGRVTHSWVELDEGASFPEHHHPHEQIISVLDGTLDIIVNGEAYVLAPGQVFVIPPDAPHQGRARTTCRVLDAFAPVREDYR
ncbi:MAG TPA: cupin domain-containing protein [Vicinamibacterales bacterium]|jgi:quercetin dioxygenase-like cupin family protein|nr:cupin domain-containing protein [Vicinamibacterales bacterium]